MRHSLNLAALLLAGQGLISQLFIGQAHAALIVYDDALRNQHQDFSWATHNLSATTPVHGGNNSIRMVPNSWSGLLFVAADANQTHVYKRARDYQALNFWIHGGAGGGQRLRITFVLDGFPLAYYDLGNGQPGGVIAANTWRQVTIPLSAAGLTHTGFDGVMIQDFSGATPGSLQGELFIDDVSFSDATANLPTGAPITVAIDTNLDRHTVNPEIFGASYVSDAQRAAGLMTIDRWGGNSTTRYNWQTDVHSTAMDYFYQNIPSSIANPAALPNGSDADLFVQKNKAAGLASLITIPTIGYTPKPGRAKSWGFSVAKYGAQDQNECSIYNPVPPWCSADAGSGFCQNVANNSGFCVNGKIVGNDPLDTSIQVQPQFFGDWINHLKTVFGAANAGGVRYYALDNEAMLWDSTHRDVHPAKVTIDEVWNKGRAAASAIRASDASAKILGPVTWGWCDLFYSGADNCAPGSDYTSHGSKPFVQWYLEQACTNPLPGGAKIIDYLDLHYYPQGDAVAGVQNAASDESPEAALRRLASVRELYDLNFVADSWIGQTVKLIPRAKAWIQAACPAIKLAITEYKWGPDNGPSAALAQAEVLGIFAREGVDMAQRWTAPSDGSRSEVAFKLYRNFDGAGAKISGDSVRAISSDVQTLNAFAFESAAQPLYLVLVNNDTLPRPISLSLNAARSGAVRVKQYDGIGALTSLSDLTIAGNTLNAGILPGRSMTLLILPSATGTEFGDGFEEN